MSLFQCKHFKHIRSHGLSDYEMLPSAAHGFVLEIKSKSIKFNKMKSFNKMSLLIQHLNQSDL